jgi:hypothetical protein
MDTSRTHGWEVPIGDLAVTLFKIRGSAGRGILVEASLQHEAKATAHGVRTFVVLLRQRRRVWGWAPSPLVQLLEKQRLSAGVCRFPKVAQTDAHQTIALLWTEVYSFAQR